jgi:hypothetical protein
MPTDYQTLTDSSKSGEKGQIYRIFNTNLTLIQKYKECFVEGGRALKLCWVERVK